MNTLIISKQAPAEINATFVADVEKAVEELYAQDFDIVIFGNDIDAQEETKFRKILSLQHYEILVVRQDTEPLKFTLAQAKFMLNNYLFEKGKVTFTDDEFLRKDNDENVKE